MQVGLLGKVEGWLEGMFEGPFTRVFRPRVQPAAIAKRLERSMEANQTVGVGKVFAPNTYEVGLNPREYEAFERYRASLEREMSSYLQERARTLNLSLITRPQVKLTPDERVRVGSVQVRSWLQDLDSGEAADQVEFTQPIEIQRVRRAQPQGGTLTVVAGPHSGRRYSLPHDRARLGRGMDNEIVLEDPRVSRYHAEIYLRGSEWVLRDLGSTNGTYVNGYGVHERALESGDRVSLGGVELVFHSRR
jgi:pSer/pThr/pTyr-binding forkhead associated (FHA) protein